MVAPVPIEVSKGSEPAEIVSDSEFLGHADAAVDLHRLLSDELRRLATTLAIDWPQSHMASHLL